MIPPSAGPACPTCGTALNKRPDRKRKCPQCGALIVPRSVPGGRGLFREDELPAFEAELAAMAASEARAAMRWYYAAVAGESHKNPDGTSRQAIIRNFAVRGALVQLIPEPQNPHDRNAIKLCLATTGYQFGYLPREQATEVTHRLQGGWRYTAIIHRTHGGTAEKPTRGVVLRIVQAPPNTLDIDLQRAVEQARNDPDGPLDWE